jgi:hypothetical protein
LIRHVLSKPSFDRIRMCMTKTERGYVNDVAYPDDIVTSTVYT